MELEIMLDTDPARYAKRRQWVRGIFEGYRQLAPDSPAKALIDLTMPTYESYCKGQGTAAERRYRVFSQRFLSPDAGNNRAAAMREYISDRQIYRDIDRALDDLMVLVFGVDGVRFE